MEDNTGISIFQAGNLHIENDIQNQEEAEDIEDQKRLQGEMQNLLTNALDEFNFDDQSTLNSSTNVSLEESVAGHNSLTNKYKNADFDDQLKVLYEARVREVRSLDKQLKNQRMEFVRDRDDLSRKYLLSEANRDRAEISLKQATEALINKAAQLSNMSQEMKKLQESFENLKSQHVELLQENVTLKNINQDILEQKDMIQKGFSTNSVSERMLEEKFNQEIKKLRSNLDGLNTKLQRKEHKNEELSQKLKKINREKDDYMIEKGSQINSLSEHLQSAQNQCRELIQVMEQLSDENNRLKKSPNNISESIRLMGLKDQSDMINALHKELEKNKESQRKQLAQFEMLQKEISEKVKECNSLKGELLRVHNELENSKQHEKSKIGSINNFIDESIYKEHMTILQDENYLLNDKMAILKEEIENLKKLEQANLILNDKVNLLESEIKSVQKETKSNCINENDRELEKEKNNVNLTLEIAKATIQKLEANIIDYENRIENYELKRKLETDREILIKKLQAKAAQFENYLQKQKETISIGINTENMSDIEQFTSKNEEIVKEKYEAELIAKEINLRQELQKEFAEKLEKYTHELLAQAKSISPNNSIDSCNKCEMNENTLTEMEAALTTSIQQIKKMTQERSDDREAISKLLNHWKENFEDVEKHKIIMANKLVDSENRIEEMQKLLQIRETGDVDLLEKVKREVEIAIQIYNKKILTDVSNMAENQLKKVADVHKKIDEISSITEKQISDIEKKFISSIKSYCVKQKSIKRKSAI